MNWLIREDIFMYFHHWVYIALYLVFNINILVKCK